MHKITFQRWITSSAPDRETVGGIIIHIDTTEGTDQQPIVGGQSQTGEKFMRKILINNKLLLIGIKLVQAVIGRDPNNIITFHHIRDIQTVESTEQGGNFLSYQTTVLLHHPEKTAVNTDPRPAIAFHVTDTNIRRITVIGVGADIYHMALFIESQHID